MAGGVDAVVVVLLAPAPLRVGLLHWVHCVLASSLQSVQSWFSVSSLCAKESFWAASDLCKPASAYKWTKKTFLEVTVFDMKLFHDPDWNSIRKNNRKKRQAAVTPFVLFFWLRHVTLQQVIISWNQNGYGIRGCHGWTSLRGRGPHGDHGDQRGGRPHGHNSASRSYWRTCRIRSGTIWR